MHAYVVRRAGPQAAEDVLSEVFTVAFGQRDRFVPISASALPWLYGIARNLVGRHFRTASAQVRVADQWGGQRSEAAPDDDRVVDRVDASREWAQVREALSGLPAEEREALLLRVWEELPYAEIAVVMDVPVGTVKSRINRARTSLRAARTDLMEETQR